MSEPVVYRSQHPDVLAVWDRYVTGHLVYNEAIDRFLAEYGHGRKGMMEHGMGGPRLVGIEANGSTDIPPGWRLDKKHWTLVPYRTTKEGKAIAKALDALPRPINVKAAMPGMPAFALVGLRMLGPAMEMRDGTLYVRWSEEHNQPVDEAIWERVKLSDYYAMIEASSEDAEGVTQ